MKFEKIVFTTLAVLLLCGPLVHANSDSPLAALDEFYRAGQNEDLNAYLVSQDTEYLYLTETEENIKTWFQAHFNVVDTLSYEVCNPQVIPADYGSLIFYGLKSKVKVTDTGETIDIDNDMVAFTIPKDGGYVIRWSILRTLWEGKLETHATVMSAYQATVEEIGEDSIKEQYESENGGGNPADEEAKDEGRGIISKIISLIFTIIKLGIVLAVLAVITIVGLKLLKNKKIKTQHGREAPKPDPTDEGRKTQVGKPKKQSKSKYCTECGSKLEADSIYCVECGKKQG